MLKFILLLMIAFSSITPLLKHPLSLSILILTQSILICVTIRMMYNSSWIPMTIFLVVVGGLMIMFIYTTSICSNKKFSFFKIKKFPWLMLTVITPIYWMQHLPYKAQDTLNNSDLFNLEFIKLFFKLNIFSSLFVFLYLLVTLLILISIMSVTKGPMRKKY
uniref:NADH dehydrogenase subunit 6 n=1 Tax=Psyllopsis discrepans TaxID=2283586 RepID=UPI002A7F6217|nr:NADH dehydrogenase subunit 6 [Psyllopsis discrepans]WON66123.1 NADH dehydrogenase subunit 6 [Psyllopsis discrepans]